MTFCPRWSRNVGSCSPSALPATTFLGMIGRSASLERGNAFRESAGHGLEALGDDTER